MFEIEQLHCLKNIRTGSQEWFFTVGEANIGPFSSKEKARSGLESYLQENSKSFGKTSLNSAVKTKLGLLPIDSYSYHNMLLSRKKPVWLTD